MAAQDQIKLGIVRLIEARLGPNSNVQVGHLTPIIGGISSEIWSFDGRWLDGDVQNERSLILRRASPTELVSGNRADEYNLLKSLEKTAVSSPRVYWLDEDGEWLERPAMIMEKAPGTADRDLLSERNKRRLGLDERIGLGRQMAEALAEIHRVDVATISFGQSGTPLHPVLEQLGFYDDEVRKAETEPMPELLLASLWLHEHLPSPPARASLVHGDFRPANVLVVGSQLTAVLDWEFAHVGDPVEDLGWYLSSYYKSEHLIEEGWSAEDFLHAYERRLGARADRAAIRFWAVFCLYKLASMTMAAIAAAAAGDNSRLGASANFILRSLLENTLRDMTGLASNDLT